MKCRKAKYGDGVVWEEGHHVDTGEAGRLLFGEVLQKAYPCDDGECDPDNGGCSYAHGKDSESCEAVRDSSGCERDLVDAVGKILKDKQYRGRFLGQLQRWDRRAHRRGGDNLPRWVRQCLNSSDKTVCAANCFVTRVVTSGEICFDCGHDFIGVSFASNFFSGDIVDMDSVLCCTIIAVAIAEAIGDLRDSSIGGDFMVSAGCRSVWLTRK